MNSTLSFLDGYSISIILSLSIYVTGFLSPFPDGPWNLTSLSHLDLSNNEMNGRLPSQLFDLSHLEYLKIGWNQFQNTQPSDSSNLTSLKALYASGYLLNSNNGFNSDIPNWIYECTNLESLDLSDNQLHGTISHSISNLTSLFYLHLSGNMLTGEVPIKQIGKLNKLQWLDLSRNKFYGTFHDSLGHLFPMMEYLLIDDNMLEGTVTERHFGNLTKLRGLGASGNNLTLNVSPNWMPPFQLDWLYLSGWNLGPQCPVWLQSQHQISQLDISNAGIEGEIPTWFWDFSSQIFSVSLSHNQLRGEIQSISFPPSREGPNGFLVYLGSNQFSGPLPRISFRVFELYLSNNYFLGDVSHFLCHAQNESNYLKILDLGTNDLSGEIPDCWRHWPLLKVINMKENKLIGSIPNSIGLLNQLESLDFAQEHVFWPYTFLIAELYQSIES